MAFTNLKQNNPQEYVKVFTDYSSVCEAGRWIVAEFNEGAGGTKLLEAVQNSGLQSAWKINSVATAGAFIYISMLRMLLVS